MDRIFKFVNDTRGWYLGRPEPSSAEILSGAMKSNSSDFQPLVFDPDEIDSQESSPLFNLPGEIRDRIYTFALADFEDLGEAYCSETYFARPQYSAHRRSDIALLRSCRRAYLEAWYVPWKTKQHTAWLGSFERRPPKTLTLEDLRAWLNLIYTNHGDIEIDHVRFFAQLYALEPGQILSAYLDAEHFHPRCITITLRATDFWYWENNAYLYIDARWVRECKFPASLRELRMELESIEKRKDQIDSIAEQMQNTWYFTRDDGCKLFAKHTPVEVTRWQGSSTFDGYRWVRDEITPEKLDYYVKTLVWKPDHDLSTADWSKPGRIETLVKPPQVSMSPPYLLIDELLSAGVMPGTLGQEAWNQVMQWRRQFPSAQRRAL